jgi:DAK2 domain fusion protein YloV
LTQDIKEQLLAEDIIKIFHYATGMLDRNKETLNALNVFPVPDGDTGTNMHLTMRSAMEELKAVDPLSISKVCNTLSMGALMGARGNSGVILSQIIRGITRSLRSRDRINTSDFARALQEGSQAAYKAVMRPTEGTILTVIKEAAKEAQVQARHNKDFVPFMEKVLAQAQETLDKTPEMLPVLKQAGVVDAGGAGLVYMFEGFLLAMQGVEETFEEEKPKTEETTTFAQGFLVDSTAIEFGYCTEMIILGENLNEDQLLDELTPLGDSLIVVGDDKVLKVHLHTNNPGLALEIALSKGSLSNIKIDNMREQHRHIVFEGEFNEEETVSAPSQIDFYQDEAKPVAVVSVAAGEGLIEIFQSLGVDEVVAGGQTMNPSTEDLLKAVNKANAPKVIILPNNKNIVMAAQQVQEVSEKEIFVVPTTSIPQGFSSLLLYNPEMDDYALMAEAMAEAARNVKTGLITYAVRDTEIEEHIIKEGDYLALLDGDIETYGKDLTAILEKLTASMVDDESEIITIYYGSEVKQEEAEELLNLLEEKYPDHSVELYNGGQPVYYYIISVE